jgi:hypothetical protein
MKPAKTKAGVYKYLNICDYFAFFILMYFSGLGFEKLEYFLVLTHTSHAGLRLASICYEEIYSVQR